MARAAGRSTPPVAGAWPRPLPRGRPRARARAGRRPSGGCHRPTPRNARIRVERHPCPRPPTGLRHERTDMAGQVPATRRRSPRSSGTTRRAASTSALSSPSAARRPSSSGARRKAGFPPRLRQRKVKAGPGSPAATPRLGSANPSLAPIGDPAAARVRNGCGSPEVWPRAGRMTNVQAGGRPSRGGGSRRCSPGCPQAGQCTGRILVTGPWTLITRTNRYSAAISKAWPDCPQGFWSRSN